MIFLYICYVSKFQRIPSTKAKCRAEGTSWAPRDVQLCVLGPAERVGRLETIGAWEAGSPCEPVGSPGGLKRLVTIVLQHCFSTCQSEYDTIWSIWIACSSYTDIVSSSKVV